MLTAVRQWSKNMHEIQDTSSKTQKQNFHYKKHPNEFKPMSSYTSARHYSWFIMFQVCHFEAKLMPMFQNYSKIQLLLEIKQLVLRTATRHLQQVEVRTSSASNTQTILKFTISTLIIRCFRDNYMKLFSTCFHFAKSVPFLIIFELLNTMIYK